MTHITYARDNNLPAVNANFRKQVVDLHGGAALELFFPFLARARSRLGTFFLRRVAVCEEEQMEWETYVHTHTRTHIHTRASQCLNRYGDMIIIHTYAHARTHTQTHTRTHTHAHTQICITYASSSSLSAASLVSNCTNAEPLGVPVSERFTIRQYLILPNDANLFMNT